MLTIDDIRTVPLFSSLALQELERLVQTSADMHLAAGEFAVPEGGEGACSRCLRMSILEEATVFARGPMMGVFNNLVVFDQHVTQNSLQSIVPELATSWSWNEDGTELTFALRQGVKWHDGKPFTAQDVKCTWDLLMDTASQKLRVNPWKFNYRNLERISSNDDFQIIFHLKRPHPAFLMLLANNFSPIYPCHVPPQEMRQHPIGTGPFKFVEFKPNEYIKVTRNAEYWKKGRPYLDGIEYTIIKSLSTATLAFVSGKVDMTFPYSLTVPLFKDLQSQMPQAICELAPDGGINRNLIINRDKPPFDNTDLRRAMALSLDRKAFIDIISEGQGDIGGVLQPPPGGLWGMPPDLLRELPGYDPDVQKSRAKAREIMGKLGYGPDNRLNITVSTRDLPYYRDPAVILIDQLKEVYIDGELEPVDTTRYFPKILRKDYTVGLNLQGSGPDPDPVLDLKLRLRFEPELGRLLQPRGGQADRAAVDRGRPGSAQAAGMGDRTQAGGRRRPADHLLFPWRNLLAALCQGAEHHGQ
jgi:peptide/nickel transport system substrate-binding protein